MYTYCNILSPVCYFTRKISSENQQKFYLQKKEDKKEEINKKYTLFCYKWHPTFPLYIYVITCLNVSTSNCGYFIHSGALLPVVWEDQNSWRYCRRPTHLKTKIILKLKPVRNHIEYQSLVSQFGVYAQSLASQFGVYDRTLVSQFGVYDQSLVNQFGVYDQSLVNQFGVYDKSLVRQFGVYDQSLVSQFGVYDH